MRKALADIRRNASLRLLHSGQDEKMHRILEGGLCGSLRAQQVNAFMGGRRYAGTSEILAVSGGGQGDCLLFGTKIMIQKAGQKISMYRITVS